MPISVDLGTSDSRIRVTPEEERLAFVGDFAAECFREGRFRAKNGRTNRWQLDCRSGLGAAENASAIAKEMVKLSDTLGADQYVGAGFGAFVLVGAMLATKGRNGSAALIRPSKKGYGMRQLLEGNVALDRPVVLVDDILNSGDSACRAINELRKEGFESIQHLSIFRFRWGGGVARLRKEGVECHWLADVVKVNADSRNGASQPSTSIRKALRSWFHRS